LRIRSGVRKNVAPDKTSVDLADVAEIAGSMIAPIGSQTFT